MLIVGYLAHIVSREPPGTDEMIRVANYIIESADAFIRRMYKSIAIFVVLMMILLALIFRSFVILGVFFLGVFLSLTAAFIGLHVAVKAGLKTVSAARNSTERAFIIAFYGGAVMGLSVIGLSLIGAGILFLLLRNPQMFVGFGFGVSIAALFAQLGGGIFTKAADIGADLVGKIEQRIPEDDPRNPATIADLVGDNVGNLCLVGSYAMGNASPLSDVDFVVFSEGEAKLKRTEIFCINDKMVTLFSVRAADLPMAESLDFYNANNPSYFWLLFRLCLLLRLCLKSNS